MNAYYVDMFIGEESMVNKFLQKSIESNTLKLFSYDEVQKQQGRDIITSSHSKKSLTSGGSVND